MGRSTSPWLICPRPNARAGLRLFCFPYAGRGASAFNGWGAGLPDTIEVLSVQLPGRENRFLEPPLTELASITKNLSAVFRSGSERPYAFFGHSMGALIAYELARKLSRQAAPGPVCLIVSGHRAPHLPARHAPFHLLPDSQFVEKLAALGGIPKALLDNPEMLSLVLPGLRADLTVCETYTWEPVPVLSCPIIAHGGLADEVVFSEDRELWKLHTKGEFAHRQFPGGHFFLHTAQPLVLDQIALDLQQFGL